MPVRLFDKHLNFKELHVISRTIRYRTILTSKHIAEQLSTRVSDRCPWFKMVQYLTIRKIAVQQKKRSVITQKALPSRAEPTARRAAPASSAVRDAARVTDRAVCPRLARRLARRHARRAARRDGDPPRRHAARPAARPPTLLRPRRPTRTAHLAGPRRDSARPSTSALPAAAVSTQRPSAISQARTRRSLVAASAAAASAAAATAAATASVARDVAAGLPRPPEASFSKVRRARQHARRLDGLQAARRVWLQR